MQSYILVVFCFVHSTSFDVCYPCRVKNLTICPKRFVALWLKTVHTSSKIQWTIPYFLRLRICRNVFCWWNRPRFYKKLVYFIVADSQNVQIFLFCHQFQYISFPIKLSTCLYSCLWALSVFVVSRKNPKQILEANTKAIYILKNIEILLIGQQKRGANFQTLKILHVFWHKLMYRMISHRSILLCTLVKEEK